MANPQTLKQPLQKAAIRATLNSFCEVLQTAGDRAVVADDSILLTRYRAFYHIDFQNQLPHVQAMSGIVKTAGYDIVCHYYRQKNNRQQAPTLFVLHGLYDHVGIFDKIIGYYLQAGFSVVAFDLPGHGLSSGQAAVIANFTRYHQVVDTVVDIVKPHITGPLYVAGQSTGGAILIDWMLCHRQSYPFAKTLLLAPLIYPNNWDQNSLLHTTLSPLLEFIPRKFTENSNDPEFLAFLQYEDPLQPRYLSVRWVGALKHWIPGIIHARPSSCSVCVIQGQEDTTVDWRRNIPVLEQKFPNLKLHCFPQLRHQVVNDHLLLRKDLFAKGLAYFQAA